MSQTPDIANAAANTDRELWRETTGDYYSPRIFVTQSGGIGINVDGFVIVRPVREWFRFAVEQEKPFEATDPAPLTPQDDLTENELSLLYCIVDNDIQAVEATGEKVPAREVIREKLVKLMQRKAAGNEPLTPQALERMGWESRGGGKWCVQHAHLWLHLTQMTSTEFEFSWSFTSSNRDGWWPKHVETVHDLMSLLAALGCEAKGEV